MSRKISLYFPKTLDLCLLIPDFILIVLLCSAFHCCCLSHILLVIQSSSLRPYFYDFGVESTLQDSLYACMRRPLDTTIIRWPGQQFCELTVLGPVLVLVFP